jgi:SAM-dependent methyltransferase
MLTEPTPYNCPFKAGDRVIELGGGPGDATGIPIFRPNIDARPGPMVDIVHDLSKTPWPLAPSSFKGVYSSFWLEHVSHKLLRNVIAEIYRILAPGGLAVLVTADTWAQCKKIVDAGPEGMNDGLSNMLFGGGDYEGNFHKAALSRPFAVRLFKEAGFWDVQTLDHPGITGPNGYEKVETDFIIEARKSAAVITYDL